MANSIPNGRELLSCLFSKLFITCSKEHTFFEWKWYLINNTWTISFFKKCLFKSQHSFAYLAFIWLFLEAASLAVIGSGRAEGIEEFLEEKNRTFHFGFHFNCRKFYLNATDILLNLKSAVCEILLLSLQIPTKRSHILVRSNLQIRLHAIQRSLSIVTFHTIPWKINIIIIISTLQQVNIG